MRSSIWQQERNSLPKQILRRKNGRKIHTRQAKWKRRGNMCWANTSEMKGNDIRIICVCLFSKQIPLFDVSLFKQFLAGCCVIYFSCCFFFILSSSTVSPFVVIWMEIPISFDWYAYMRVFVSMNHKFQITINRGKPVTNTTSHKSQHNRL